MSQKCHLERVSVRGTPYLGERDHEVNGMPGPTWSQDPEVVMDWLCDGFRFRFNQHRSKRSKYLSFDGEVFVDSEGEKVLIPIGSFVDDYTDRQARSEFSHLAAIPSMVLQAPQRLEDAEWWSALKRRKTNMAKGRPSGAMPGFRSAKHSDQTFTCWYNAGANAVFTKTGRKSGMVVISGANPSGRYGPGQKRLNWKVRLHIRLSQPIRPYTSVRVNWTKREVVFVNSPSPLTDVQHNGETVGLDQGCVHALASSDGEFFDAPDCSEIDREIRSHQKRMAKSRKRSEVEGRKFWESKRYRAHRAQASKLSRRKARMLDDWRHKTATSLIRQYDVIALEDLVIRNMTRKGKGNRAKAKRGLNRSMLRVGLADLSSKIEYRAILAGVSICKVNPAYTSQRCNRCGHISPKNRESQAVFRCVECGHFDNADINAAKNILDSALGSWARTLAQRGASVRPKASRGPVADARAVAARKRKPLVEVA